MEHWSFTNQCQDVNMMHLQWTSQVTHFLWVAQKRQLKKHYKSEISSLMCRSCYTTFSGNHAESEGGSLFNESHKRQLGYRWKKLSTKQMTNRRKPTKSKNTMRLLGCKAEPEIWKPCLHKSKKHTMQIKHERDRKGEILSHTDTFNKSSRN